MTRTCTVCHHKDAAEINRRLVRGEHNASIAREFALKVDALRRHKDSHIPQDLIASPSVNEKAQSEILDSEIEAYKTEINEMKDEAREEGNIELALKAIDKGLKCIEIQSKARGLIREQEINVNTQVNYVQSEEWISLRTRILYALDPYPSAKEAIVAAIRGP